MKYMREMLAIMAIIAGIVLIAIALWAGPRS